MMLVLAGSFGVLFLDGGILRSNLGEMGGFLVENVMGMGELLGQPETFAKSKTQQEIVNAPSFPRRRESWLKAAVRGFAKVSA